MAAPVAIRAKVTGRVQGVFFRDSTVTVARGLGVQGWVRNGEDGGTVLVHAEGDPGGVERLVAFLRAGPPRADVEGVDVESVKVEGHQQFAVRGVPAGIFVIRRHEDARAPHFDLRLEVDGVLRSWAVPKEPSMDPAVKRLAVQVDDHGMEHADVPTWDRGTYEQGGRVPWPRALDEGHAVFVLHGERLRGGFALQRTSSGADPAQWLLIKRRDEYARPPGTTGTAR